MHRPRLIPLLQLSQGRLVKTEKFSRATYVGDPLNTVRIFNEKEVDELFIIDIDATRLGIEPDFRLIESLAGECAMPLCVGGGIYSEHHASVLFSSGVEKVCLQSGALANPDLIPAIASRFGTQAVVASVDVTGNSNAGYALRVDPKIEHNPSNWKDHIAKLISDGAGEILLTSVDREGTRLGMDLDLIQEVRSSTSVPLVAHGGAGSLRDVAEALRAGADAVASGSFLVFRGPHRAVLITYPSSLEIEALGV